MNKTIKSLSTFLSLIIIVSCSSQETKPNNLTETNQIFHVKTQSLTPTLQPELSTTPSPKPTETVFQETLFPSMDLPPWLSDDNTSMFVITFGSLNEGAKSFGVVNASTGEVFNFQVDGKLAPFWTHDGQRLGVLLDTRKDMLLIDLNSGETSVIGIEEQAIEYAYTSYSFPQPLVSPDIPTDRNSFRLYNTFSKISDSGNYLLDDDYDSISIINLDSGDIISVTNEDDDVYDLSSSWVPNTDQLSIVQSAYPQAPGNYFEIGLEPNIRLNIFDFQEGDSIKTFPGVTQANWSPDGRYLLFQPFVESGKTLFESAPCVLNTHTNQSICLNNLKVPVGDHLPEPARFHSLSWSPSGELFSFAYYSIEGSGLCIVEVDTFRVRYLLDDLFSSGYHVAGTSWSPDEKYIDFQYGRYSPFSDADLPPYHGVLEVSSGEYIEIGETISDASWKP